MVHFVRLLALSLAVVCGLTVSAWTQASNAPAPITDSWITTKVAAAFFVDNDIKSRTIDVSTTAGVVTLTGTVRSETERAEAVSIAKTIDGVKQVVDKLKVQPDASVGTTGGGTPGGTTPGGGSIPKTLPEAEAKLGDAWVTAKVQAKYFADSLIKSRNIDVTTQNGVVTLRGSVESEAERQRAVAVAQSTDGVARVVNELKVAAPVTPTDKQPAPGPVSSLPGADEIARMAETDVAILGQIKARLALDPAVSVLAVDVDVDKGVVTLKGDVASEAAKTRAAAIARDVRGVTSVKNELRVR